MAADIMRQIISIAIVALALLVAAFSTSAQDGRQVYERACAACHGAEGQGTLAPALVPFTRGSQDLLRIVRAGAGNMMNGFSAAEVSNAEVRAIEQYLRGLSGRSAAASKPAGAAGGVPVTFGSSAVVTAAAAPAPPRGANRRIEWPYVGADQSNTRYSPLEDLTVDNVSRLQVAWRWRPEERQVALQRERDLRGDTGHRLRRGDHAALEALA